MTSHHSGLDRLLSAGSVLLALAAWYFINALRLMPDYLLPGPLRVLRSLLDVVLHGYRETSLLQNLASTLSRLAAGFALACVLGIPLGLAMGYDRKIRAAFEQIVQFMRPLPPLSYLVLLILWFGIGEASKIALLYLAAFPIVAIGTMAGVRSTKIEKIQAAQSLGATEWQVFRYVILPSALPLSFTGMRIALATAFGTVVAAELLAATDGLGWMVFSASKFLRHDIVILGIIILGILGMLLNKMILLVDRAIIHWRGAE